jgi:uncharacterized protein YggE
MERGLRPAGSAIRLQLPEAPFAGKLRHNSPQSRGIACALAGPFFSRRRDGDDFMPVSLPAILASRFAAPLALAALLLLPAAAAFSAERPLAEKPFPAIVVSGEGVANAAPDIAMVSFGVTSQEETARAALTANNEAMAKVIAAMKEAGVEARDLQTSGFNIQPVWVYPKNNDGTEAPRIVGYSVSNQLSLRIRDLSKLGELLDRAVTLGVNDDGGISFGNDKPDAIIATARTLAMKDAISRAETLAAAAGMRLGQIVEISEGSSRPRPMPMAKARSFADAVVAEAVPVEAGESSYSVSVQVTFEILQ